MLLAPMQPALVHYDSPALSRGIFERTEEFKSCCKGYTSCSDAAESTNTPSGLLCLKGIQTEYKEESELVLASVSIK